MGLWKLDDKLSIDYLSSTQHIYHNRLFQYPSVQQQPDRPLNRSIEVPLPLPLRPALVLPRRVPPPPIGPVVAVVARKTHVAVVRLLAFTLAVLGEVRVGRALTIAARADRTLHVARLTLRYGEYRPIPVRLTLS